MRYIFHSISLHPSTFPLPPFFSSQNLSLLNMPSSIHLQPSHPFHHHFLHLLFFQLHFIENSNISFFSQSPSSSILCTLTLISLSPFHHHLLHSRLSLPTFHSSPLSIIFHSIFHSFPPSLPSTLHPRLPYLFPWHSYIRFIFPFVYFDLFEVPLI